jgi:hypothetical protein
MGKIKARDKNNTFLFLPNCTLEEQKENTSYDTCVIDEK